MDWKKQNRLGLVLRVFAAVFVMGGAVLPAGAVDVDVQNDADYARLVGAMRAAEYVRSDVIVSTNPRPRVYATLAATMAFAEQNPEASGVQVELFLGAIDTALSGYAFGDQDLNERANFYAALRFAVINEPALAGTDTRVGRRALALLGIVVPDPDGFESIQRRMVRYELALARPLDYRNEVFDLLVTGFYGVDPAGNAREELPALLDAYFAAEGFDPALGEVREDMAQVNAGLAILPTDFAGYQLAISVSPENEALRNAVTTQLDTVRAQIDAIVGFDPMVDDGSLDFALAGAPGLEESVDLAMNDAAYVQSVLDELRANLEATAEARAAASAASFLMLQSQFGEIEDYATYTRDYSSIALQTNDDLSTVQSGVSIAGNLAIGIAGFYTGDPLTAAGGFLSAVTEAIGLAGVLTSGPSVDEQTFDQVVALRMQVEVMRQEMHERFDRIDQQLNIMYNTIVSGFNAIGDQIGDLQGDVDAIIRDMAVVRSQLRRLEAALYGVAQDILLTDLTNQTNVVLDYRDENGIDLPYSGGSPDFITASESFFTYATLTSQSEAFVGSRSNSTVNLGNAYQYVGDGPVSGFLNDLAVLPVSLGVPSLSNVDLAGIEPWSQAASAYAQLARESPWYFAYRYGRQVADYNADPQNESMPELDRIVVSGDQLYSFVERIREVDGDGSSALFAALVQNYKDAAASFQAQVDAEIVASLPSFLTNNGVTLDLWAQGPQENISTLIPNMPAFDVSGSSQTLAIPYSAIQNGGFGAFTLPANPDEGLLLRALYLSLKAIDPDPDAFKPRVEFTNWTNASNDFQANFWFGAFEGPAVGPVYKSIRFSFDYRVGGLSWFPYFGTDTATARDVFKLVWDYEPTSNHLDDQTSSSSLLPSPGASFESPLYRVRITGRTTFPSVDESTVQPYLFVLRERVHTHLLLELFEENSALWLAARELDDAEALLDAYVTIGMPKELSQSEVLRSALRAVPGTSELGLGSIDIITLINDIDQSDSFNDWSSAFSVVNIGTILNDRIDVVHEEILRGLQRPAQAPEYVGWVLNELEHLRTTAFSLAVDDTYVASANGTAMADAIDGVLVNDVDQEYRTILVDTAYELDPAYVGPSNGSVVVNADGSFMYDADPGFVGTDSFTYRSMTTIPGVASAVYSLPATVVIVVPAAGCGLADFNADGQLNFFDVSAFLVAYQGQGTQADLNQDGLFNFFDVSAFLVAYQGGCP